MLEVTQCLRSFSVTNTLPLYYYMANLGQWNHFTVLVEHVKLIIFSQSGLPVSSVRKTCYIHLQKNIQELCKNENFEASTTTFIEV